MVRLGCGGGKEDKTCEEWEKRYGWDGMRVDCENSVCDQLNG